LASQVPLPQLSHKPQSTGQLSHDSKPASHTPSPQLSHWPQSSAHEVQFSSSSQAPLPQLSQTPQSWTQLPQVSPSPQLPSPQSAQKPQSGVHVTQLSSGAQVPLPHVTTESPSASKLGSVRPHALNTAATTNISAATRAARRMTMLAFMGSCRLNEGARQTEPTTAEGAPCHSHTETWSIGPNFSVEGRPPPMGPRRL